MVHRPWRQPGRAASAIADRGQWATSRVEVAFLAGAGISIADFGPYTHVPGVRTEQIAVYGVGVIALLSMRWIRASVSPAGMFVVVLLAVETLVALVGTLLPVVDLSQFSVGNPLAGLNILVLPIVVLVSVWTLLAAGVNRRRLLTVICRIVVLAMCANAVLAYWSQISDLTPLLSKFWENSVPGAKASTATVAGSAAQLGRYTGLFNQPAEAGEMYGIALLAAIYLYLDKSLRLAVTGILISVGGILSVSKIFLLVGLPVGVWQVLREPTQRLRRLTLVIMGTLTLVTLAVFRVGPTWMGTNFLTRLLHPGESKGLLDLYTGGRLGGGSSLREVTVAVLDNSPWFGFGAGGLRAPYDNGWVEALCLAGIVGAAIYTAILLVLATAWIKRRIQMDPAEARLSGGLVILAIAASVGLPALTADRAATIIWLLFGLSLLAPFSHRIHGCGAATATDLWSADNSGQLSSASMIFRPYASGSKRIRDRCTAATPMSYRPSSSCRSAASVAASASGRSSSGARTVTPGTSESPLPR